MALLNIDFHAGALRKDAGLTVIAPDNQKGPFPVLYLLHGLSDDHTHWHRYTSLERYVAKLPLIVVMPDGHRSFYCNEPRPGGSPYEDHIVQDVVGFVDRTFHTVPRRTGRAIAGLSMGGYGAVMLAMRHPEMFSVACSHSGALAFARRGADIRFPLAAEVSKGRYDCFSLARDLAKSHRRLSLRIDCGTEDGLLDSNRQFHAHLDKLGVAHEYYEYSGAHNWAYWDEHIQQTLQFVMGRVG